MKKDTKPRYRGVCPLCGKENWICKSILMDLGVNSGAGSCLGCGEYMHITFNPYRQEMELQRFADYAKSKEQN